MHSACYVGPMWSGKTTLLLAKQEMLSQLGTAICIENPVNTRDSERDLRNLCPKGFLVGLKTLNDYLWLTHKSKRQPQTLSMLFDEVHLYDIAAAKLYRPIFIDAVEHIVKEKIPVFFYGLFYDFYNDFQVFPIWIDLIKLVPQLEIYHVPTRAFCYACGGHGAYYSVNINPEKQERVGDHYANACWDCAQIALVEWKNHETRIQSRS